jgi:hypothetical protein
MDEAARFDQGMAVRRQMLGEDWVDGATGDHRHDGRAKPPGGLPCTPGGSAA